MGEGFLTGRESPNTLAAFWGALAAQSGQCPPKRPEEATRICTAASSCTCRKGGDMRLDNRVLNLFRYVGLRSQSLADPTLSYGALSGRRAVSWSWTRLRKVAAAIVEQLSPTASQ